MALISFTLASLIFDPFAAFSYVLKVFFKIALNFKTCIPLCFSAVVLPRQSLDAFSFNCFKV